MGGEERGEKEGEKEEEEEEVVEGAKPRQETRGKNCTAAEKIMSKYT